MSDLNLFMMCERAVASSFSNLPDGYTIRSSRPDEFGVWKAFPFDDPAEAEQYDGYMDAYFQNVYGHDKEAFFEATKFVCDSEDVPVATCAIWPAYGQLTTIHWLKVLPNYEGLGIGRALLSELLRDLPPTSYPIYLHTQPGSFRAIKLYSDLGFKIIDNDTGSWPNDYRAAMLELRRTMPSGVFATLEVTTAPDSFIDIVGSNAIHEF
jgi:ribosomal protein S18 acetylase RimI-like enzyme